MAINSLIIPVGIMLLYHSNTTSRYHKLHEGQVQLIGNISSIVAISLVTCPSFVSCFLLLGLLL